MARFSTSCRRCDRLAAFLEQQRADYPNYYAKPVPSFGDPRARLLIVGLAPGMHGANATGRPFTGDHAGILLYETLHRFGFGSAPASTSNNDGLRLRDCRITNAVRCLPPGNKPSTDEVNRCNDYLTAELTSKSAPLLILALGTVAHRAVLRACQLKLSAFSFAHGAQHQIADNLSLTDSYHCSRYNTQTRRLTTEMFHKVFAQLRAQLDRLPETASRD